MLFSKNIYKNEKLLSVLDLVIDYFIENNQCDFCLVKNDKENFCLRGSDLCKSFIFEGLWKETEKLEEKNACK